MKSFVHFFLISSLLIIIAEAIKDLDESKIERLVRGPPFISGLPPTIKLLQNGEIFRNDSVVVWKGKYRNETNVAIKIHSNKTSYEREMQAYLRLEATASDFDFLKHGIPKVYHHGRIFGEYDAIVMTLFDDIVEELFKRQGHQFSLSTVLLVFREVVGTLKYIHSKGVLHNGITLSNIFASFLIPRRLFIADFDASYLVEPKHLIEDYEQLMAAVRRMSHAHTAEYYKESGGVTYHIDPIVQKALQDILHTDVKRSGIPDYDTVIAIADGALTEIESKWRPLQFDWMRLRSNPSSGESSRQGGNRK